MKALVLRGDYDIAVEERPDPGRDRARWWSR